ncbi:MAG TPA: DNA repair protein RecO [Verrucomicrobiae bacterium]|nr:DNA repair protein RecO [Verrucomicrobiae bacterium]
MVEKTRGLILRVLPLTETSLIVDWLTPEFGRISTAAKGARRTNSPFRGKLDLFYLTEFSFVRSKRSELHTLREVKVMETHPLLRRDLQALQQAAYCARLLIQATEKETPLPEMFRLMTEAVDNISAEGVIRFEVELLTEMGMAPGVGLNAQQLGRFILYHLGKVPAGREEALRQG